MYKGRLLDKVIDFLLLFLVQNQTFPTSFVTEGQVTDGHSIYLKNIPHPEIVFFIFELFIMHITRDNNY